MPSFCFRGGWNQCRARGLYAVVVFVVACMAIAAASTAIDETERERESEREREWDPFVLSSTLRAAESRLAGIADWTTQPRRDAANYPPDTSSYPERDREKRGWDSPRKPITPDTSRTHSRSRAPVLISSLSKLITSLFLSPVVEEGEEQVIFHFNSTRNWERLSERNKWHQCGEKKTE